MKYEIPLTQLIARNKPYEAYALLLQYGERPQKTPEAIEAGLDRLVKRYGEEAAKKIAAIHPHLALFKTYPDVLGLSLPEHKEEKPQAESKKNEKFNACGCNAADGNSDTTTKTETKTDTKTDVQKIFTPTNISLMAITIIGAALIVSVFMRIK